jgi:hypothetical protein
MKNPVCQHQRGKGFAGIVGSAVALVLGLGVFPVDVRAQQLTGPPAGNVGPGWYGYTPGGGWVLYVPPSAPGGFSGAATPPAPGPTPVPGWAGYSPATGWTGYAPASSPFVPAVRPPRLRAPAPNEPHRYAANLAVNHNAPQFISFIPWYREYGTGRRIPLSKPWLPASP